MHSLGKLPFRLCRMGFQALLNTSAVLLEHDGLINRWWRIFERRALSNSRAGVSSGPRSVFLVIILICPCWLSVVALVCWVCRASWSTALLLVGDACDCLCFVFLCSTETGARYGSVEESYTYLMLGSFGQMKLLFLSFQYSCGRMSFQAGSSLMNLRWLASFRPNVNLINIERLTTRRKIIPINSLNSILSLVEHFWVNSVSRSCVKVAPDALMPKAGDWRARIMCDDKADKLPQNPYAILRRNSSQNKKLFS